MWRDDCGDVGMGVLSVCLDDDEGEGDREDESEASAINLLKLSSSPSMKAFSSVMKRPS